MSSPPVSRPHNKTDPTVAAASSQPLTSHPTRKAPEWADTLLFWFDWGIKVLGIAAAVVFGIWAPLSYDATNKANNSDDAVQSSMINVASAASSQASSAAAQQSVALDAMNSRIGAIGQLWLLDFCLGNTGITACQSYTSEISVPSLVNYLASTTSAGASTSGSGSSTPTSTSTPSSGSKSSSRALSLPAILGIVFAVILFLGTVAGIFVSQLKRLKRKRSEEE